MELIKLLQALFGKNYLNKIIGTGTNVSKPIKMDKNSPFKLYSDSAFKNSDVVKFIEKKIAEYGPFALSNKNASEVKNFEMNARRLLDAKRGKTTTKPEAEIFNIATSEKVDDTGIMRLKKELGLPKGVEPGSLADKAIRESVEYKTKQQGVTSVLDEDYVPPKSELTLEEEEVFERLTKDPYRPGGPLDPAVGITRAGARLVLENKGIKIGSKDPLDLVRANFGQDFLNDINNLSEEMLEIDRRGGSYKDLTDLLKREGLLDAPINKDAPKGYSDAEMKKIIDDTDPEDFATGGRVNYSTGTKLRLLKFFKDKGKNLATEIKKAVEDIFPSGDSKYDADVVVDNILEDLGVDRDMFDEKDIMNLYGMVYNSVVEGSVPKGLAGFMTKKGKGTIKTADKVVVPDEVQTKKELRELAEDDPMNFVKTVTPKFYERMELKIKYPGISDDLIEKIMIDDNPQRKAEVLATIDEAFKMMEKGMSSKEVLNIIKNTTRTKNAGGGLNYLMGM